MRVMIANNSGREARRLLATFPDRIAHLYSPPAARAKIDGTFPYAIDNGAYGCWTNGRGFDVLGFRALLAEALLSGHAPLWVAAPDVVSNRERTIALWRKWYPQLARLGWPLAFVVQDGMTPRDVPANEACLIFVGGTTEWKWTTLPQWCDAFVRVHVGRVNTAGKLHQCARLGVESVDGTGYFRGRRAQLDALWYFLADESGTTDPLYGPHQRRLFA